MKKLLIKKLVIKIYRSVYLHVAHPNVAQLQGHKNQELTNIFNFLPIMAANIVLIYHVWLTFF